MTASRTQHFTAAGLVLAVAISVTWLSFTQEPVEAFLFPRLISVVFSVLAAWNFIRAASGMAKVGTGLTVRHAGNIWPGLLIMLVYALFAAKTFGFFASSAVTFLAIYTLYDPTPVASGRGWARRVIVTIGFMIVIYGLFALLLKVQTPRGLFI